MKTLLIGISLILVSCHPDHEVHIVNLTREEAMISYDKKSKKIPPNTETSYNDLKYSDIIILEVSKKRIPLGEKLKKIEKSYHAYTASVIGEPHYLLIQINQDGYVYLGYKTIKDKHSDRFKDQPKGFPIKWN